MPVTVKQLTINTKVKKGGEANSQKEPEQKGSKLTKSAQERIIQECMNRVREMIENEYKP